MNTQPEMNQPAGGRPTAGRLQLLTFLLGSDIYAIDIVAIREILQHCALTPVPRMPACVLGVINLRGTVVPIIDLKNRLGLGERDQGKRSCTVILDLESEGERTRIGLRVDAVSEVVDLDADDVDEAPRFGTPIRREFILGIGRLREKFITIVDPARALRISELLDLARPA